MNKVAKYLVVPIFSDSNIVEQRSNELRTLRPESDFPILPLIVNNKSMFGIVLNEEDKDLLKAEETGKAEPFSPFCGNFQYIPELIRFMDKEYVDEFFKTGEIQLSSFESFAHNEDELRRDDGEGRCLVVGNGKRMSIKADIATGYTGYVLCTSLSQLSINSEGEQYTTGLIIQDAAKMISLIQSRLWEMGIMLRRVEFGPCVYGEKTVQNAMADDFVEKNMNNLEGNFSITQTAASDDILFRKPSNKREEHEYRIIFDTFKEVKEPMKVYIPELRECCKEFNLSI